jgi:uncharacterized protein with PIN domain
MSTGRIRENRFLVDRMLGTLCRYLRFMGYDAVSANAFKTGNKKEDTMLLQQASDEDRILLTKDRELARRGGDKAFLVRDDDVMDQVGVLARRGMIEPVVRMTRCSLCNRQLRSARPREIEKSGYAPQKRDEYDFFWCPDCKKLYWMGSHGRNLDRRIKEKLGEG